MTVVAADLIHAAAVTRLASFTERSEGVAVQIGSYERADSSAAYSAASAVLSPRRPRRSIGLFEIIRSGIAGELDLLPIAHAGQSRRDLPAASVIARNQNAKSSAALKPSAYG